MATEVTIVVGATSGIAHIQLVNANTLGKK